MSRELNLEKDFQRDHRQTFAPTLAALSQEPVSGLSIESLLSRAEVILEVLRSATYYSILAPLSAALRKAIFKVQDEYLDNGDTPEVAALRSLQELALDARSLIEVEGVQMISDRGTVRMVKILKLKFSILPISSPY